MLDGCSLRKSDIDPSKYCIKNDPAVSAFVFGEKCKAILGKEKCAAIAANFDVIQFKGKLGSFAKYSLFAGVSGLLGYGLYSLFSSKDALEKVAVTFKGSWGQPNHGSGRCSERCSGRR